MSNQTLSFYSTTSILDKYIFTFMSKISSEHDIPMDSLIDIWNSVIAQGEKSDKYIDHLKPVEDIQSYQPPVLQDPLPQKDTNVNVSDKPKSKPKSTSSTYNYCEYEFVKGSKAGTKCGVKTKLGMYCSKHASKNDKETCTPIDKSNEDGVQEDNKKTPTRPRAKTGTKSTPSNTSPPSPKNIDIVLTKHPSTGYVWNEHTGIAFNNINDIVAIGSIKDNVLYDLTDDDILTCEKYNFKHKPSNDTSNNDNSLRNMIKDMLNNNTDAVNVEKNLKSVGNVESFSSDSESEEEDGNNNISVCKHTIKRLTR